MTIIKIYAIYFSLFETLLINYFSILYMKSYKKVYKERVTTWRCITIKIVCLVWRAITGLPTVAYCYTWLLFTNNPGGGGEEEASGNISVTEESLRLFLCAVKWILLKIQNILYPFIHFRYQICSSINSRYLFINNTIFQ